MQPSKAKYSVEGIVPEEEGGPQLRRFYETLAVDVKATDVQCIKRFTPLVVEAFPMNIS